MNTYINTDWIRTPYDCGDFRLGMGWEGLRVHGIACCICIVYDSSIIYIYHGGKAT